MKLKKIASLALAGVMAVSMLAGCSNGGNTNEGNTGNDNNTVVTPSTTPVVEAVNKGQSASNSVKVNFTVNNSLDAALKKSVSVRGSDSQVSSVAWDITVMTGLKQVDTTLTNVQNKFELKDAIGTVYGSFAGANLAYGKDTGDKSQKDKTWTAFAVVEFDAWNDEAALNSVAYAVNSIVSDLPAHSDTTNTVKGAKYYSYGYTGNISMVSVQQPDGSNNYYVAFVLNQTVTESTLK